MSSFGDTNMKTRIEQELRWIAEEYTDKEFYEDKEAQVQFMIDVLDVLRYMCED